MSKRFSINMISTVTNQGKVQFMIYSENMNSAKFIEFLQQLIKNSTQKIFLILATAIIVILSIVYYIDFKAL
jgi:mitochondrial fission protein ELM1